MNEGWKVLDDPDAAEVLLAGADCFEAFFGKECTITEVAKNLGLKLNAVAYRVERLVEAGLLEVKRTKKQRGRTVNVYTSVADKLFVPLGMTEAQTLEALLKRDNAEIEKIITKAVLQVKEQLLEARHSRNWGIRLYRDDAGTLKGDLAVSPGQGLELHHKDAPVLLDSFTSSFMLNVEDAKKFQGELEGLEKKYAAKGGSQRYVFRLALARLK
jgi:DNA-binding MarR family transcriptional regulator